MTLSSSPRVWLLHGSRAGDNAQVTALGNALGWPYEIKRLFYFEAYAKRRYWAMGPSLDTLDPAHSDRLAAPWPDLVIAIGRRSVPVAQWIRRQNEGRTRLVQIGRPNADLSLFDLVITTPQYGLSPRANVLHLDWPLITLDRKKLFDAAEIWVSEVANLPKPWIGLIVGGDSAPYYLDGPVATHIGRRASALANSVGGSLLVTTSPRTAPAASEALIGAIDAPCYVHRFAPDAANPYLAFLALADRLIVTAESVSMLTEACSTGKPVETIELPAHRVKKRPLHSRLRRAWRTRRHRRRDAGHWRDPLDQLYDWIIDRGLTREPRNVTKFLEKLQTEGRTAPLGAWRSSLESPLKPLPDPFQAPVTRIKAWFEKTAP